MEVIVRYALLALTIAVINQTILSDAVPLIGRYVIVSHHALPPTIDQRIDPTIVRIAQSIDGSIVGVVVLLAVDAVSSVVGEASRDVEPGRVVEETIGRAVDGVASWREAGVEDAETVVGV